jgi:hypothetical protein
VPGITAAGDEYKAGVFLLLGFGPSRERCSDCVDGFVPQWTTPINSCLGTREIHPGAIQVKGG